MNDLVDRPQRPAVWADGKWRIGGWIATFQEGLQWLRENEDPTLPPYLAQHCLDPVQIARFIGEPLEDFDWKGPDSSQTLAAIQRVEGILKSSAAPLVAPPVTQPDFLFAKSGNRWILRFRHGKTVERGDFDCRNGFAHYWRLLQSPYRAVPSLSLSPNKGEEDRGHKVGTAIGQDEFFSELSDMATFTGFREEGFGSPLALTNDELKSVASEIDQLESRIAYEAEQERSTSDRQERAMHAKAAKDFKKQLRQKKREAKTRYESLPEFGPSQRASGRVKIDLQRAREALRKKKMVALADYLEAHVERDFPGWKYSPTVNVAWTFFRDE